MWKQSVRISTLVLIIVALVSLPMAASTVGGEINGQLAYEWDEDTASAVQTMTQAGFRLVLEDDLESLGKIHFSTKGHYDFKTSEGEIALDQLYVSGYTADVDYIAGRHIISWGTADGFNPTNYFGRMSSGTLTSGDLTGEPIWAGEATYYAPNWAVTGVVVPIFVPQTIDEQMRTLLADDPEMEFILGVIDGVKKPERSWRSAEYGVRAETNLSGWDVQLSYFTGFEPLPGLRLVTTIDPNTGMPVDFDLGGEYRRQRFAGIAAAGTVGDVGVWAEMTYGGPTPFEGENPLQVVSPLSVNKNYVQAVAGADYTFPVGNGLLAQGQYIYRGNGSLLMPYHDPEQELKAAHYLYGRLAYDFSLDSTLELIAVHELTDHSGLLMPMYTHRFPNSIQVQAGFLTSYGTASEESAGEFSRIPSQARIGVTYKF